MKLTTEHLRFYQAKNTPESEEVTHVCISVIDSCVGALSIDGLGRRTFKPGEEAMIQAPWVERGTAVTDAQSQAQTIDELSAMIQRQEIRIKVIEERIAQPQKFYLKGHTEPC